MRIYHNQKGEWKIRIERATHVPLTLGKAKFMIANVLAAT
jgi:cyanophycin synthetase